MEFEKFRFSMATVSPEFLKTLRSLVPSDVASFGVSAALRSVRKAFKIAKATVRLANTGVKMLRASRRAKKRGKIMERAKQKVNARALSSIKQLKESVRELSKLPAQIIKDKDLVNSMSKGWTMRVKSGLIGGFFTEGFKREKKMITPVWVHIPRALKDK
jgi:hypothetical protein